MNFRNGIQSLLASSKRPSRDSEHDAGIIGAVAIVTLVMCSVTLVLIPFFAVAPAYRATALGVMASSALLSLWLLRRGSVRGASYVLVSVLWIGITLLVVARPGLDSSAWWLYIAPIFLAGMLLGAPATIAVWALTALVGGTFAYLFEVGSLHPIVGESRTLGRWIAGVLFLAAMTGLILITRRRLASALESAAESENRYRDLVENSQGIVCTHDPAGKLLTVNPAAAQSLGYDPTEAEGRSLFDLVTPANRSQVRKYLQKTMHRGTSDGLLNVVTSSGEERVWACQSVLKEYEGQRQLVLAHALDITERNRTQELNRIQRDLALELNAVVGTESAANLCLDAAMQVSSTDCGAVYLVDEESGSMEMLAYKGLSEAFVVASSHYGADSANAQLVYAGKPLYARYSDLEASTDEHGINEGFRALAVVPVRSGARIVACLNLASRTFGEIPPYARQGIETIAAQMGTALLRARSEEALRESEQRFRTLFDNGPDAMFLADPTSGIILDANAAASRLLLKPRSEIIGLHQSELHPPWLAKEAKGMFAELSRDARADGRTDAAESLVLRSDGVEVPVEVVATLVLLSGKWVQQGTFRDITERKQAEAERGQLEQQLRTAQKMEALGTLAGGVAHDFNNILLAVFGYAELAKHDLPEDDPARKSVENVLVAAERASKLVGQILTYSRQHEPERDFTRVQAVAEESLSLLRATIPSTIEIRQRLSPNAGPVLADPAQIQQVLMNLCTNAAQAMGEDGGLLEVTVEQIDLDTTASDVLGGISLGRCVHLKVSDTGHGMDPATVERVFDPFFTTKGTGKGTGLGLSVVHGIVHSHGGSITVESEIGRGSTFSVYLPCADEQPAVPTPPSPEPSQREGTERVLFVDDEAAIAEMSAEHLQRLGYQVTAKNSSEEALKLFRAQPADFDVIITDQTMPGCTGLQLATEVRNIRPEMPVVLITGFSEAVTPERLREDGITALVTKPFASQALAAAVRQALDGEGG